MKSRHAIKRIVRVGVEDQMVHAECVMTIGEMLHRERMVVPTMPDVGERFGRHTRLP